MVGDAIRRSDGDGPLAPLAVAALGRGATAALAALVLGCAWVPLSEEGEATALRSAGGVAGCERLGKTTSTVAARVGFFRRGEERVAEELANVARNEAARMGGNAVVPESPVEDGRRVFGVYRCP